MAFMLERHSKEAKCSENSEASSEGVLWGVVDSEDSYPVNRLRCWVEQLQSKPCDLQIANIVS